MNHWLSQQEVSELTGKIRYKAQCRVLDSLGYVYDKRCDGSPVVLRQNFYTPIKEPFTVPNWGYFNAKKTQPHE